MDEFIIQHQTTIEDGIGGIRKVWLQFEKVEGYIDLLTGTDLNTMQNSFTEESTHILIIPNYTDGIEDDMRVLDKDNRFYNISYVDNPVGQNHHNEIYLTFGGVLK